MPFESDSHGRCAVVYPQLVKNVDEVGFDGGGADMQFFANFSIAGSFGYQLQHLNFAGAQIFFGGGANVEKPPSKPKKSKEKKTDQHSLF